MKTRTILRAWGLLAVFVLPAFVARADNPCIGGGNQTNYLDCVQGTLASGYVLSSSNITVNVGQVIPQPTILNLSITNGYEFYYLSNYCNPDIDGWYTNNINYTFEVSFAPSFPPALWAPGVYNYTGEVEVIGSPCGTWTTNVGIVTINVATNNPDILIDVDFGEGTASAKTGYAAIGDSANDFWNEYGLTNQLTSSMSNLVTAEGQISPIGLLATNLPTFGTNGSPDPMYNDYLSAIIGQVATMSITNLPAGSWNIYLYADDSTFDLNAGSYYGFQTCYDQPLSDFLWQDGVQYVVFTNVTVSNGEPVTIDIYPGENWAAMISGMQIASASHTSPYVPFDALAYYPFSGNANDVSGHNLNAQVYGATLTSDRFGNANSAYSFNGSSDYMTVSDTNSLLNFDVRSNSYTIAFWVKLFNTNQSQTFAIDRGTLNNPATSYNFSYDSASNTFNIAFWDAMSGSVVPQIQSVTHPLTNVWYHVALVCSSGTLGLYINGNQEFAPPDSGAPNYIPSGFGSTLNNDELRTFGRFAGSSYATYLDGDLDDIIYYGRALSASEIYFLYAIGPISAVQDSDYDGVSDYHELEDRTDPNNPNSVLQMELGSWGFDNTNTWAGDQGQLPLTATNIVGVLSWSTNAVQIDTNNPGILCYRDVETNGNANINLRSGTVRFWFRPDWSSTDQGGAGPGDSGRLIEMGSYHPAFTNGWWSLYLSPDGTQLLFGCSTNGTGMTNLMASVSWDSNIWHQIALTYTPTNSFLYFDGQLLTNGPGSLYYPNVTERAKGFRIGSDASGANQARGAFDVLETFNYPLDASDISDDYQAAIAQDNDGDGLPDIWEMDYYGHLGVDPNADPNGDGMDNAQDAIIGLNPLIPEPIQLGYWRFNNAPSWQDEEGLNPLVVQGLFPIPDWSGDAVEINSQYVSMLGYPGTRTNGIPAVTCPVGSISFWFKPDWNGATPSSGSGGPGANATLFEIGRQTTNASYGWFGLTVDPFGTQLSFATESNGVHANILQSPVPFNSHTWYQVVLTYNTNQTELYVNGQLAASGSGLTYFPSDTIVQQGFYFGCNWDGTGQANGRFDELQTFNYPLSATEVASNYTAAMSVLAVDGLPVIVKDGWGLRSDAFDTDCDGVPDAWKIANGYNPAVPATTEELDQYMGINGGALVDTYSTVSISNVMQDGTFSFGTNYSAGNYKVVYVDGAWADCFPLNAWCVDQVNPSLAKHSITVLYNSGGGQDTGQTNLNGSINSDYANQADAEAGAAGSYATFTHYGGDISMKFVDDPVYDNANGNPPPTYTLYPSSALVSFEARASLDTVYLLWTSMVTNLNVTYDIYRAVGSTNTWSLIGSTTDLYYADTNLSAGTIYYYQLQWSSITSSIVSAVPFDCPDPLPPRIDYVDTLLLPANNGTYSVSLPILLANSDAFDPQGYPLVFKVDSLVRGTLMINGLPFSADNCTISNNTTAVWVPSSTVMSTNLSDFRVYVFDGVNRSTNVVDVSIKQHPQTSLLGWAANGWGTVGNGAVGEGLSNNIIQQAAVGLWGQDPRWQFTSGTNVLIPQPALDITNVSSVYADLGMLTAAVDGNGQLWLWGFGEASLFGKPVVESSDDSQIWAWGSQPVDASIFQPAIAVPSPVQSSIAITNVLSVSGYVGYVEPDCLYLIILKNDGTVWSIGANDYGQLGRDPLTTVPDFYGGYEEDNATPEFGMLPEQVNIPGHVVQIQTGWMAALALCTDGSVWTWGQSEGDDWTIDSPFLLGGYDGYPSWQPERVTALDIPGAAPIVQISASWNHYICLRGDGSVSEIGYIPSLDYPNGSPAGDSGNTIAYSDSPVPVDGLPTNVFQISAGSSFGAALTTDGNVWVWGIISGDVLGDTPGDTTNTSPRQISSLHNIVKICAGYDSVLALDQYGAVWGWGLDAGPNSEPFFGYDLTDPVNGDFISDAVRIPGIENVTNIFCSEMTAFAVGTVVQGKPDEITATPMNQAVQLSWTSYPGASYYIIYRSSNPNAGYVAIGRTANTSFIDSSRFLQNGQTYYYEISAVVNGLETDTSWEVSATPMPPPTPVQDLALSEQCCDIVLTWGLPTNAAVSNPQEYYIKRADNTNGPFLIIAYCESGTTTYQDNTIIPGQTNYYQVIPVNSAGMAASPTVAGTTDEAACALCPTICSNWVGNGWFSISQPDYSWQDWPATLLWTGPQSGYWLYTTNDDYGDWSTGGGFISWLEVNGGALPQYIVSQFSSDAQAILTDSSAPLDQKVETFIQQLNNILQGPSLTNVLFTNGISMPYAVQQFANQNPTGQDLVKLNRMILDDQFLGSLITGPSWGTNVQFCVEYHYYLGNYGLSYSKTQIISASQAVSNSVWKPFDSHGDNVRCYSYSWPVPLGIRCWASVSVIVNGQQGASSIEVGPMNSSANATWTITPNAVPGYKQVYLDWPDDLSIYNYQLNCTALIPSQTHNWENPFIDNPDIITNDYEWVTLTNNLFDPRYWHADLTATNFTPVDFKYVADLISKLTNAANDATDPVSSNLWNDLSPSAQAALINFEPNEDTVAARANLAADLTQIIQSNSIVFSTNDVGMEDPDLSTETKVLLGRWNTGDTNAVDVATLNRLLLEDAYVHDIARYETPSPVEFVSGDFNINNINNLLSEWYYYAVSGSPYVSIMARNLWNLLSPAATNQIITDGFNVSDPASTLAMQRLLAVEFSRIVQTNGMVFTTNEDTQQNGYGVVCDRAWNLINDQSQLTNNYPLVNRLLLEDGLGSDIEPLSDLRYYWVTAVFCDLQYQNSYWVGARPNDQASAPPPLAFSAQAYPYNGMVMVQWNIPGITNDSSGDGADWQFSVARNGDGGTPYNTLSYSGFELSYMDSNVTNDMSYTYQVTAFDTNYNQYVAVTSAVTPTNASGLTLLPPQPGDGCVNLTWTPIQATAYNIMRSLSVNGPFSAVGNNIPSGQNAQNTYEDFTVQDGLTYYYQIQAFTPSGFQINSEIQSATPLPTLAARPPSDFKGQYVPDNAFGQCVLSWNPRDNDANYQLFLVDQSRLTPLVGYDGTDTSFAYEIPPNTDPNAIFTFAVRSISSEGLASGITETTVTNTPPTPAPITIAPVVLQVGGSLTNLTVVGPTNLALIASVNVPAISQVDFFADGSLIGIEYGAGQTFQMTWFNVSGGTHTITATAIASDPTAVFGTDDGDSYNSASIAVTVNIQPLLSPYQTTITDLQLPAQGLPIVISRSYTSRISGTNGPLGIGWSADWALPSVTLTTNLDQGWVGVAQSTLTGNQFYFGPSAGHYVTVNLPNGQSIAFDPQLNSSYTVDSFPQVGDSVGISYQSLVINGGSLRSGNSALSLETGSDGGDPTVWNGANIQFLDEPFNPGGWTYTDPSGTQYTFGQSDGNLIWLLTKTTDMSGNSLTYTYDANTTNLIAISNSCGRGVTFTYVPTASGTNIEMFDTIGGSNATVVYVVSSNRLAQVLQLVNRTTGTYLTNSYTYGDDPVGDSQDYDRLTEVFDARGIETIQNSYTNGDGDTLLQISQGQTNAFLVDTNTYSVTVTSATSTGATTVEETNDADGAPAGTTLPASGSTASTTLSVQNAYNNNGLLTSQADANGNNTFYLYDSLNRLVGRSDPDGNSAISQLSGYGKPTISTNANGAVTVYRYDNADNPVSMIDPSETVTTYTYSQPLSDGNGNVLLGELETSESQEAPDVPYTIVTTNHYDTTDPIKGDLLQMSQEWVDGGGNVIGSPVTTCYTYDGNGNRLTQTTTRTVNGGTQTITSAYTYDAQNRVIMTVISATGSQTLAPQTNTVTYNELGKQATSTDAAGRTTTNVYDFNGNQIETEYPDGTVSRTAYDGFGNAIYTQDRAVPVSGVTTAPATYNVYDASKRVIQTGRSDGVQLTKETATAGVDFSGTPNETEYKVVVANSGTLLTTNLTFYDAVGNVQYSVSARGAVTQNQYDPANRLTNSLVYTTYTFTQSGTNIPTPTGPSQSTSYTYDPNGNQLTETDARGNSTTSYYDDANNLVEMDEPPASGVTYSQSTYYDGLGRKIESEDEMGIITAYTYDFRGLLTSVTLGLGTPQSATTVYRYDEAGNETSQMDAAGRVTTFQYDALGRRTGRTLPGGQSEGFAYDLEGNQIYHTNFNGVVITNQYDVDNRLTNCSSMDYNTSYAYSATGLRTNMSDTSGTTAFYYNDLSELTNKTVVWYGGPTISLKYGYDANGSITNIQSSTINGVNLIYNYDILGRLTNVLANGSMIANYGYDILGNLQGMGYGNGVTNLYQYDAMNRLTNLVWNLNNSPMASFAYTLGATGNRLSLLETISGAGRYYGWSYDPLYRLTQEIIRGATAANLSYGYDVIGNRTNRTSDLTVLPSQARVYNANDWMTNSDGYDNDGNTTNSTGSSYQYDMMDHLTNVNNGQIVITYDGDGDRVSKKVSGATTYYLVDDQNPSGYAQVLEEWTSTGTPTLSKIYNYGSALISQYQPGISTNYFITDGHGSTRMLADNAGNVVNVLAYDAYGNLIVSNGVLQTGYLYSGQQWDTDLDLYYNRSRYLNTGTGRFWTMDTDGGDNEDPLSLHKYLYAADDPVNLDDPSGNDYGSFDINLATILLPLAGPAAPIASAASILSEPGLGVFTPVAEDNTGFAYLIGSSTNPKYGTPPWTNPTIVQDAAGVKTFEAKVNAIRAKGEKISLLCFYGHGDQNQNLGCVQMAEISWSSIQSATENNVLDKPELNSLFKGLLWPNATIMLEFCYSLDNGTIPNFFLNLAPQAKIWGTHGQAYGFGDYGDIYPWYLVPYEK